MESKSKYDLADIFLRETQNINTRREEEVSQVREAHRLRELD